MSARALFPLLVLASCSAPLPQTTMIPQQPAGDTRGVLLAAHNRERAAFGSEPMGWDETLAAGARSYARKLEQLGRLQHSPKALRPGQGENLWIGSRGAYPPEYMVGSWASEKRHFRHGIFPAVSKTGNWRDVGHYSQLVWPRTTRVGCGIASGARWDVLVCRYAPPGNQDGARI